jgi:diacylglycerol kinase (ATP)
MTRIFVIFNPAARGEKSQRLRQFLESKRCDRVTLAPTQQRGDATRLAASAGEHDIVVAAGGDGTINEVLNGLNGATLGVLPLGTVNVFAHELNIPRQLPAAWALIESGRTREIDLPCAEAAGRRRWFCQLAGVGFDARAVRAASWELKKKIGPLSYVWAGLKTMGAPGVIEFDGVRGVALLIGNGRFYGGRYRLFPEAKLDDGLLDACFFERVSLLRYGPAILLGRHTKLAGVHYVQAKEFSCVSAAPFQLDGEDAGDGPVKFSVKPRALRVIAPQGGNHA